MTTPIFDIEEWEQNQEQPHVTSNTAWRILESMSSRRLISKSLTAAPGSPADGAVYWIDGVGTGDWAGHSEVFAVNIDGDWHYVPPQTGWIFWVDDEAAHSFIDAGSPIAWSSL